MKKTLIPSLIVNSIFSVVFLSFFSSLAFAQVVQEIEIIGNQRVDKETVRVQLSSKPGEELNRQNVSEDIKKIYKTGFFTDVKAKVKNTLNGVVLAYFVNEKSAIRNINISGQEEFDEEEILEKLNLKDQRFLDPKKVKANIEELRKEYQDKGLYGTKVNYRIDQAPNGEVDLVVNINEGEEKRIRKIVFQGNQQLRASDLSGQIDTARYKWWSSWITGSGVANDEKLDNDKKRLTEHYLRKGFAEVKVAKPQIVDTTDGINIVYNVNEGQRYNFGEISVVGDLIDNNQNKTLDKIKSANGKTFNVDYLRQDTFGISDKFTDIGYAFANVEPLTKVNRENKTVDIAYKVSKGELTHVNKILFNGNDKTRDNVLRRNLKIQEQEVFSSSKIRRSQELLRRLGFFDEVTIVPQPTDDAQKVNLNVGVKEAQTGTFSIGAGVSSGDGVLFNGRVSENNVLGTGNSISVDVNTGTTTNNFLLSFTNPRVNDTYLSFGVSGQSVIRRFDNFDRTITGGGISLGYPLLFLGTDTDYLDDIRVSLGYQYNKIEIDNLDDDAPQLVIDQEGETTASSILPRLIRNTIDNPLDPSSGSRQVLNLEYAGLGGEENFWLVNFNNSWFYPIIETNAGDIVFSQRIKFGWGENISGDGQFPLFRRFFPGGIDTNRGFAARELGPQDENGNEFGGNKQLLGTFETIFPISQSIGLKGVLFYDVGNAFDDEESINFGELRHSVGWGFRWRSPIAPIRIEIGHPLNREEGDNSIAFNFSLGAPI